jgi:type IV pilus assembly protein PilA
MDPTGLPVGSGQGEVDVTATTANSYTVTAISKSGGTFTISRTNTAPMTRDCSGGTKGCTNGHW